MKLYKKPEWNSFTRLKDKNTDWWETITPSEREEINTGLQQLDNGEGIPYNTVKDKVDQLLKQ